MISLALYRDHFLPPSRKQRSKLRALPPRRNASAGLNHPPHVKSLHLEARLIYLTGIGIPYTCTEQVIDKCEKGARRYSHNRMAGFCTLES